MRALIIAAVSTLLAVPALAQEKPGELKKGPGLEKVQSNCGLCHSLDYVQMNSPFLNAAGWDSEVTKMIKAFGAPISDADAAAIKEYLSKHYGG